MSTATEPKFDWDKIHPDDMAFWRARRNPDGTPKSHRQVFPDQYQHAMIGQPIKRRANGEELGTATRTIESQYGTLIFTDRSGDTCYAVSAVEIT